MRELDEQQPAEVMCELIADFRPPEHPVRYVNRVVAKTLGEPDQPGGESTIELAYFDPVAGI